MKVISLMIINKVAKVNYINFIPLIFSSFLSFYNNYIIINVSYFRYKYCIEINENRKRTSFEATISVKYYDNNYTRNLIANRNKYK